MQMAIEGVQSRYSTHHGTIPEAKRNSQVQVLLILLAFCEKNIVRYALLAFSMLPGIGFLSDFILATLYIVLILLCVREKPKLGLPELAVPAFVIAAIVASCVIYPQNAEYILDDNNFWNTIFPCLRWFIVGLIIIPDKELMTLLGKASCIAIYLETVFLLFYMIPNDLIVQDDMNRAYQLLPNVMIACSYAFNSKKPLIWTTSIVGLLYLLALGTRGPFLIAMAFLIINYLRMGKISIKEKIVLLLLLVAVSVILSIPIVQNAVLKFLHSLLTDIGLSTRIVDHMLGGTTISNTSGRDLLYETALAKIAERPFLGYGVYGEWPWIHWNVHNMYLELWVHYGVVLGTLLLAWGLRLVGSAYFKSDNTCAKDMITIFSCFVLLRGFFGGSYLMFGAFFLIGLCIKEKRRNRAQARRKKQLS